MHLLKTASTSLAISGLLLGATAAQAATAYDAPARKGSATADSEQMGGTSAVGWIIAALVAVGVALVISNDNNNNDYPTSP